MTQARRECYCLCDHSLAGERGQMSTFIHLMRGQMSIPLDELGGKCPYMPFLGRGQMSEGAHVRPPLIMGKVEIGYFSAKIADT